MPRIKSSSCESEDSADLDLASSSEEDKPPKPRKSKEDTKDASELSSKDYALETKTYYENRAQIESFVAKNSERYELRDHYLRTVFPKIFDKQSYGTFSCKIKVLGLVFGCEATGCKAEIKIQSPPKVNDCHTHREKD